MNAYVFFLLILFVLVVGASMGVMWLVSRSKVRSRIRQMTRRTAESLPDDALPETESQVRNPALEAFERVQEMNAISGELQLSPLSQRMVMAGLYQPGLPKVFFTVKIGLTLLLSVGTFLLMAILEKNIGASSTILLALGAAFIGYLLPDWVLNRLIQARQTRIRKGLPDAADFLVVCVEAGTALDSAFMRVAKEMQLSCADLAREMHWVTLEFRAGRPRNQALQNLAERTGVDEVETLTNMLNQADRFGTSTAAALRVYADMLRVKRKQEAQERAAKIPVKLLFPLIFFIFPALLVVLLGPAIVEIGRVLLPTLTSK